MARRFQSSSELLAYVRGNDLLLNSKLWELYEKSDVIADGLERMATSGYKLILERTSEGTYSNVYYPLGADTAPREHVRFLAIDSIERRFLDGILGEQRDAGVFLNTSQLETSWLLDDRGFLHRESIARALAHELIHTLFGQSDPRAVDLSKSDVQLARDWLGNPAADFLGDTVNGPFGSPGENKIGVLDLGGDDAWIRASYLDAVSGSSFDAIAASHKSFTNGNYVEDVFADFGPRNVAQDGSSLVDGNIDFSARNNSSLILGQNGDDKIKTGSKNDYLYGGDGKDELDGGLGSDFLAGGAGNDKYTADDGDTPEHRFDRKGAPPPLP